MDYHNLIVEEFVTQAVAKAGGQVASMSDLQFGVPGLSTALVTTWIGFSVAPTSNPRPRL